MDMCAMVPKPLATKPVITTGMNSMTSTTSPAVASNSHKERMEPPKSMCNFSFFAKPSKPALPAALGAPPASKLSGIRTAAGSGVSSQLVKGNSVPKTPSRISGIAHPTLVLKQETASPSKNVPAPTPLSSKPQFSIPRTVLSTPSTVSPTCRDYSTPRSSHMTVQDSALLALTGNVGASRHKDNFTMDTDETTKEIEAAFYFESDHVALKGNRDYQSMLKTVIKLEAQRTKAILDLDKVQDIRDKALTDPLAFVQKLQLRQDVGFPEPLKVADIPNVLWEKYAKNIEFVKLKKKHSTRHKRGGSLSARSSPLSFRADSTMSSPVPIINEYRPEYLMSSDSNLSDAIVIRGRLKDANKPSTFNQLWTAEEQKRLEEHLLEFPPEEVEARRWEKIAKSLGNRTTQQVASRVQKYFIKLAKAGLPIPGRMPNVGNYNKKGGHRHQRYNRFYFQPSTFLTSYEPPVYMSDDEDGGPHSYSGFQELASRYSGYRDEGSQEEDVAISDEDDVPADMRETEEYQEILRLKKAKKRKLRHDICTTPHLGYKCDMCACEPITGTRWHCRDCPQDISVDCCDECIDCEFETPSHNSSHKMEPIYLRPQNLAPTMDRDYTRFMHGDYNYLDPNYMPAT